MRGLEAALHGVLDRRLQPDSPRPLAVALSGGSDSLALTIIADAWAHAHGRDLLILTVDHQLRAESAAWTRQCAALAERLGRSFRALAWTGDKPTTGLPAAARAARHRLLADATQEAGGTVLLMGHTADDVAEAQAMRAAGSTTPDPHEWAPSPAWPEGRGVFVLRPMLGVGRAELRTWLAECGEAWIDDPANDDTRYARTRARHAAPARSPRIEPPRLDIADLAREAFGIVTVPRNALRTTGADDARRLLALAAVSAGGGDRLPQAARTTRLADAIRGDEPTIATLAGARIEADEAEVRIFREAGEAARGGLGAATPPGVWDGRFEIGSGREVRRLHGLARQLPADQQAVLRTLPATARGALPAVLDDEGAVTCPALSGLPSLVGERLRAAAGLIQREPA